MPRHEHLPLARACVPQERRKTGRPPAVPLRGSGYGGTIRTQVEKTIEAQRRTRPPTFVDPSLVLRVEMNGLLMEEDWERLGLTVLSDDDDRTLVLFSSQGDLSEFLGRLDAYDGPIPDGQQHRRYVGFVNRIVSVGTLEPRDRLGIRLREQGLTEPSDLQDSEHYTVDVDLWEFGPRAARERKAQEIETFLTSQDGQVFDVYLGPSITQMRVHATGRALRPLLYIPEVASLDLPPKPDLDAEAAVQVTLGDAPEVLPVPHGAPTIGVLDSGLNDHPLLEGLIAARAEFPDSLATADVWGHGTRIGGVALFGDLREAFRSGQVTPAGRLAMAKVVDDRGKFPERRTLPRQMREAVTHLVEMHGCRLFVVSLGDVQANLGAGRVGPWAVTLDELAREFDIVFFVAAGNRMPRPANSITTEEAVTHYPQYLLESENRLCEPAGAANVVTVGALATGAGLAAGHLHNAHVQAITLRALEPSPFSRSGPGAGGIRKPDFTDVGGTLVFDASSISLRSAPQVPEAGVITLSHDYTAQLLTSGRGTSYAAPMLANKAAHLLRLRPRASANLIRALLANAVSIPDACNSRLSQLANNDRGRITGHGVVNPLRAAYSDDHRVVLFAEGTLDHDHFAIYSVPIPPEFQGEGRRTIRASLAFDPPVRGTRAEYIGTKMNFRLLRGCPIDDIVQHFRARTKEEGPYPKIESKYDCQLQPGPKSRDGDTLQTASRVFMNSTASYGGEYHLVVRCVAGWAAQQEADQRFAVVVELEHQPSVRLYARVRQRVQV